MTTTNGAFRNALDKFIHIGNCYYNAKHYDNVLNIFDDLEREDQRVLLLGVYHLHAIMEHGIVPGTRDEPNIAPKPDPTPLEAPPDKTLSELKVWFFKVVTISLLGLFILIVLMVIFLGGTAEEGVGALSKTFKIFSLLF